MTVATIPAAVIDTLVSLSELTLATDPPPANIETAQLPCAWCFTGEAVYEEALEGESSTHKMLYVDRTYRVQVAVLPLNQATPETRETRVRPVLIAVRDRLISYSPSLGGTAGVLEARVQGDSGVAVLPEYGGKYLGFEVRIGVRSILAIEYAEGE